MAEDEPEAGEDSVADAPMETGSATDEDDGAADVGETNAADPEGGEREPAEKELEESESGDPEAGEPDPGQSRSGEPDAGEPDPGQSESEGPHGAEPDGKRDADQVRAGAGAAPIGASPAGVLPPDRQVQAPIGAVRQAATASSESESPDVPADVRKYERFKKVDGAEYERVNEFLRERTYVTAREWAIARLCSDFRTETGIEMTKIGENLPHLVPFMTDTYTPQAVNQARSSFETKVRKSGATFLYGAMSDFFTADELDEIMYEVTEVAKFLLEVEGVDLSVDEELEGEERISSVMREVRSASDELRHEGTTCPNCGHEIGGEE